MKVACISARHFAALCGYGFIPNDVWVPTKERHPKSRYGKAIGLSIPQTSVDVGGVELQEPDGICILEGGLVREDEIAAVDLLATRANALGPRDCGDHVALRRVGDNRACNQTSHYHQANEAKPNFHPRAHSIHVHVLLPFQATNILATFYNNNTL